MGSQWRPLVERDGRPCGYCESHATSAPRSTIPCFTSKTIAAFFLDAAYLSATSLSSVHDMNATSTPPRTLYWFGVQNGRGSSAPETPRYSFVADVSLLSLMIALLITWSVVVYLSSGGSGLRIGVGRAPPAFEPRPVLRTC